MIKSDQLKAVKSCSNGFTLIELIIVITALSIIISYTSISVKNSILHNQLQKTSFELLSRLSSMRAQALRDDSAIKIKFTEKACSVFTANDDDGVVDDLIDQWKIGEHVKLGLPLKKSPPKGPDGVSLPTSKNVASGQWKDGFTINNDAIGTFNSGAVYLHSPNLCAKTYCITSVNSQTLKVYNWDGVSWLAL